MGHNLLTGGAGNGACFFFENFGFKSFDFDHTALCLVSQLLFLLACQLPFPKGFAEKEEDSEDEAAENLHYEEVEEDAEKEDEQTQDLQGVEELVTLKKDILDLQDLVGEKNEVENATKETPLVPASALPDGAKTEASGLEMVLAPLVQDSCSDEGNKNFMTYESCLARFCLMAQPMKDFIEMIRLNEGFLSHAAVTGTVQLENSEWHTLQHQLALARANSMSDGQRVGRMTAWKAVQQKVANLALSDSPHAPLQPLSHAAPGDLILYRLDDGNLKVGMVFTVYRGALLNNKKVNRRMRSTKPSAAPLVLSQCSQMRVVEFKKASAHHWCGSSLNPVVPRGFKWTGVFFWCVF